MSSRALSSNLVAALALMGPMGHAGLAAAASVGAYVNLAGLLWTARRRFGPLGGRALLQSLARTALACVPLLVWCLGSLHLADRMPLHTNGRMALWLGPPPDPRSDPRPAALDRTHGVVGDVAVATRTLI